MQMAIDRSNPSISMAAVTAEADEIYEFLKGSAVSRETPVTGVIDTPPPVTDSEQAHNQAAIDQMKAFYAPEPGGPTTRDVGGKPATASRSLADMIPGLTPGLMPTPVTTYPGQNPLNPHANIPYSPKGYE